MTWMNFFFITISCSPLSRLPLAELQPFCTICWDARKDSLPLPCIQSVIRKCLLILSLLSSVLSKKKQPCIVAATLTASSVTSWRAMDGGRYFVRLFSFDELMIDWG